MSAIVGRHRGARGQAAGGRVDYARPLTFGGVVDSKPQVVGMGAGVRCRDVDGRAWATAR
jgi:hypothetical protein